MSSSGIGSRNWRRQREHNQRALQRRCRWVDFDSRYPAQFAWQALLGCLIREAKSHRFMKGDAADLCHAVIAMAFSHFATLDTTWKRRAEGLPQPNALARVFGPNELGALVADVEAALMRRLL